MNRTDEGLFRLVTIDVNLAKLRKYMSIDFFPLFVADWSVEPAWSVYSITTINGTYQTRTQSSVCIQEKQQSVATVNSIKGIAWHQPSTQVKSK